MNNGIAESTADIPPRISEQQISVIPYLPATASSTFFLSKPYRTPFPGLGLLILLYNRILKTMHPQKPQITSNIFHHSISSSSRLNHSQITIYFITGNPGLIGYYHSFLSLLSSALSPLSETSSDGVSFRIYGRSLAGFEVGSGTEHRDEEKDGIGCYDLEDQILYAQRGLNEVVSRTPESNSKNAGQRPQNQKVILIGHSVGSYIAMEVLRRHRESQNEEGNFDIIGGIMLFPTVIDIAKSPAGVKLTVSPPFPHRTCESTYRSLSI